MSRFLLIVGPGIALLIPVVSIAVLKNIFDIYNLLRTSAPTGANTERNDHER